MNVKVIMATSRKIVIELYGCGAFYTDKPYRILVNGRSCGKVTKTVHTINGLVPDTDYYIVLASDEVELANIRARTCHESFTLDVRDFGAKGDGKHDDTLAIQAAICCCTEDGRVYVPEGNYAIKSIFLKSNTTIDIGKGAVLSGCVEREDLAVLPGMIQSYDEKDEYNLGTWEGNPLDMFSSMVTGINVRNVVITGEGILDGHASNENWWKYDREKIIAYRPRMIFLNHCSDITVHGITVQNSPAWNIHPYFSNHVRLIGMDIINPWDSPNTDGIDPESVNGLEITGVHFSVGDDCIAIKSGKYYMGSRYKTPSQNIEIRHCFMEHGHGAVTLGSEMSGGIKHVHIEECAFNNTDRGLRIKTRRGRGIDAIVDDILFRNISMNHVMTPFVLNCFYNQCDPDGHSDYVKNKTPLPVDYRTPSVKQLIFQNITVHNCHVTAAFIYGLPENKVDYVELSNIVVDYDKNAEPDEPAMMDGINKIAGLGFYINNVKKLVLNNIKIIGNKGDPFIIDHVDEISSNTSAKENTG